MQLAATPLEIPQTALIQRLIAALADRTQLESRQLQRAAFSPSLAYGRHFGPPAPTARQAAVMVVLERRNGEWVIPLTVRPETLADHPGQISLPGGRLELGELPRQAAQREFCEELGCQTFPGELVGELSPLYVYNSNYLVVPFIAVCSAAYAMIPCPAEVARVLYLPIGHLTRLQPAEREFQRGSVRWTALTIELGGSVIWGATAIVLAELSVVLRLALN
jgi:8-oxo-dGTP pyrophosphatase MutT (NUDIX family)